MKSHMHQIKTTFLTMFVALATIASSSTYATELADSDVADRAASALELIRQSAPIKSAADLHTHLAFAATGTSPMHQLSDETRQSFIDSLVFTEQGLASFRTKEVKQELDGEALYEFLKLFGRQYYFKEAESHLTKEEREIARSLEDAGLMADDVLENHYCKRTITSSRCRFLPDYNCLYTWCCPYGMPC